MADDCGHARLGEPDAMGLHGVRQMMLGNFDDALAWLSRADVAGSVNTVYNLGACHEMRGDLVAAAAAWRRGAAAGDADAMLGLVRLMLADGDRAGAARWYPQIIEAQDTEILVRLGVAQRDAGDDESAYRTFAVAAERGDAWAMTYYADGMRQRGETAEAIWLVSAGGGLG